MSPVKNTLADSQRLYTLAVKLLHGRDGLPDWALAEKLSDEAECSYITAIRWIKRARRVQPPAARGGHRDGSGYSAQKRQQRAIEKELTKDLDWLREDKVYHDER